MTPQEARLIRARFSAPADIAEAERRLDAHEPLAYILGEWYFWRQTYRITPDVLVPQPDSELLVEHLVKNLPSHGRFADLCTGSGCIAISALCERPDATAVALELSPPALEIARENALRCGVTDRLTLISGDVTQPGTLQGDFDQIVSNPPYIRSDVIPTLAPEVQAEPRLALDGGEDGLQFYRALLTLYPSHLRPGGSLLLEIGYDQAAEIRSLAENHRLSCRIFRDYGGNDRVAQLRPLS